MTETCGWVAMAHRKFPKPPKNRLVAFKADADLAGILASISNRSDFIRDAIYAHLGRICPTCRGSGTVMAQPKLRNGRNDRLGLK